MDDAPWYKNAHAYCAYCLFLFVVIVMADVALTIWGNQPEGLPEAVTTGGFGICTFFLGLAGGAQEARTKAAEKATTRGKAS